MRKIILMVVAAMMATVSVSAQSAESDEPQNEIAAYYGFGSASNIVSALGSALLYSTGEKTGFWGPIGVEYYRHLKPEFSVGLIASYAGCKWDRPYSTSSDASIGYFTVMPSVKFNWLRKENIGMYTSFAAGVMYAKGDGEVKENGKVEEDDVDVTSFMFHISIVGFEAGKKFRGFGELGFGEKGFLCLGVRYRF